MPRMKSTSLASPSCENSCTMQLERARRGLPDTEIQKPNSHTHTCSQVDDKMQSKHDKKVGDGFGPPPCEVLFKPVASC